MLGRGGIIGRESTRRGGREMRRRKRMEVPDETSECPVGREGEK